MRWLVVVVVLMAGCVGDGHDPGPTAGPDAGLISHVQVLETFPELRLETDHGTIGIILYSDWTPQTVQHISALAQRGVYDGTTFHRVIDDFVIQGGDPTGTGQGGSGPLGTYDMVPLEVHPGLDFGSGAVGLARWTDDTGDSQFFITEKPALHLSRPSGATGDALGAYSLFGQVFAGLDVVRSIAAVETAPHADRPIQDVMVRTAKLLAPPDADLIALVPVVFPVHAWGQDGHLEMPRYLVAGHPAVLRFTVNGDCALGQAPAINGPGPVAADWQAVAHDDCTRQAVVTFPVAGTYNLAGQEVQVTAWHDDYAAYTGSLVSGMR